MSHVIKNPIPRLDKNNRVREKLLPFCRLRSGEVWEDRMSGHRVGCLDASSHDDVCKLMGSSKANLAIHDPPYNMIISEKLPIQEYIKLCEKWVLNSYEVLLPNSSLYIWLGADQKDNFQPLPDFMIMMRETGFKPRSFITMRNQRGYGTQSNWMSVRQELLYYVKGVPKFRPQYTRIPKTLQGYYKEVNDAVTDNIQRSKSPFIRAGNVWFDIQQVFYRMEENVNGCYAQKPLAAIERILKASSERGELVMDFFAHSGSTLLQCEISRRLCYTMDIDPIFCEITIRRLEHFRNTRRTGWQNDNPFSREFGRTPISKYECLQHSLFIDESTQKYRATVQSKGRRGKVKGTTRYAYK